MTDSVIEQLNISEEEQQKTLKNDVTSRVRNQIAWARLYLVKAAIIDSSKRAVWALTSMGQDTDITDKTVLTLFKATQKKFKKNGGPTDDDQQTSDESTDNRDDAADELAEPSDYKSVLPAVFQQLPPDGFERMCKQLLHHEGFERVVVTGRTNNGETGSSRQMDALRGRICDWSTGAQ